MGVAVSGTVNVVTANTTASIGNNAHINDLPGTPDTRQSVLVAAADQFHLLVVSGALAVGSVGVGVGVTVGVIDITTEAKIGNDATVKAAKDVAVVASGSEAMISVAVTLAGGAVGVAGAVGVFVMHVTTHADTGSFVTIRAGNNGLISASDDTKLIAVTGGAAGGFVGVGVGVQVDVGDEGHAGLDRRQQQHRLRRHAGLAAQRHLGRQQAEGHELRPDVVPRPRRPGALERELLRARDRDRRRLRRRRRPGRTSRS